MSRVLSRLQLQLYVCLRVCVCQSDESKGLRLGWRTLESTTAPVTHAGLWGLTRLYLTPRACTATTLQCVCVSHTHTSWWGGPASNFWAFLLCCSQLLQLSGLHRQYRSDCWRQRRCGFPVKKLTLQLLILFVFFLMVEPPFQKSLNIIPNLILGVYAAALCKHMLLLCWTM